MERKKYYDIAKAIGIISVVYGHLHMWTKVPVEFYGPQKFIYVFHMPFFFLMAGLNIKLAAEHPVKTAIVKRFKGILAPYFIWCLLVGVFFLFHDYELSKINSGIVKMMIIDPLIYNGNFVGSWFFPCLFWTQILAILLILYFKPKARIILLILIGLTGMLLPVLLPKEIFAFVHRFQRLDIVLSATLLVGIGYMIKDKLSYDNHIAAAVCAVIAWLAYYFNSFVNMNASRYGNFLWFFAGAFAASYLLMYISKKIEKAPYVSPALSYIGKNTVWVLFFHEGISRTFNYIFNASPADGIVWSRIILYLLVPSVLPPFVIYIYKYIKENWKTRGQSTATLEA